MSFREKIAVLTLIANVLIYGMYFGNTAKAALAGEAVLSAGHMISTIVLLIVVMIVGTIIVSSTAPKDADAPADERDRLISMRGDQIAGYVVSAGAGGSLVLALAGLSVFWIANLVLLALVAGEIVKSVACLIGYRQGV
jgi:hypothetical protein